MATSYDLLNWKSAPSSLKLENTGPEKWVWHNVTKNLPVVSGKELSVQVYVKQEDVVERASGINFYGHNGEIRAMPILAFPKGTYNWQPLKRDAVKVPSDVTLIDIALYGGKGTTWYDDLYIYQDDALIYENKFSNWGLTLIPVAAIGTGLGVVWFGKKG